MKNKALLLSLLLASSSVQAGFGDFLNKAKEAVDTASEVVDIAQDPLGQKAEQEREQARIAEEERKKQEATEREQARIAEEERKKQEAAEREKEREQVVQGIMDKCDRWKDLDGKLLGQQAKFPMNQFLCVLEENSSKSNRPKKATKVFNKITFDALVFEKLDHGNWVISDIRDGKRYSDSEKDMMADMLVVSILSSL